MTLGPGCRVGHGAIVDGHTRLGSNNRISAYAIVGGEPHDLKYAGESTRLEVGDDNVFREHATIHRGTVQGGGLTSIGHRNLFMSGVHVGHDCVIGSDCVFSFSAALAGHVEVSDHAILGGLAGVHQFVKIGAYAFVSGGAKLGMDMLPFMICQGMPARLRGVNEVGMQRHGYGEEVRAMRQAYRLFFRTDSCDDPIATVRAAFDPLPGSVAMFLDHAAEWQTGDRKLMRPRARGAR